MSPELVGFISLGFLLIFLGVGMPVGFAMTAVGFFGYWAITGFHRSLGLMAITPFNSLNVYSYSVLPLFIFMGMLAYYSGLGEAIFYTAKKWIGRLPGGLAIATCLGCAAFGVVGDAVSAALTLGKIVIPEMEKAGYDRKIALGVVASAGPIASMIPPSALMVVYGVMVEVSIGKLMMAGILPGILTALIFSASIYIRVKRNPKLAPLSIESSTWREKFASFKVSWVVFLIFALVFGGIYSGIFTPTEVGGMAALIVLIAGIAQRRLNGSNIWVSLMETAKVQGMFCIILIGAFLYGYMFTISNLVPMFTNLMKGMSPYGILTMVIVLYLILGCFMQAVAMLFLTMPFVYPLIIQSGFDPVWFGILVMYLCEVGCTTPPFGITLFAVKSIAPPGTTNSQIVQSIVPYLLPELIVLVMLVVFPQISLYLVNTMMT